MLVLLLSLLSFALGRPRITSLDGCNTPYETPNLPQTFHSIREKFFTLWSEPTGVVFLRGGAVTIREGTDTEVQFRQESNFLYLTGVEVPDFALLLDLGKKIAILFAPERDQYWAIWNGVIETLEELSIKYGFEHVLYDGQIDSELAKRSAGSTIYTLPGTHLPGFSNVDTTILLPLLKECRVTKTPNEIQLLTIAANVSSDAHLALMRDSKPGLYEYNFASYFKFYTESCRLLHQAYLPITASGAHAAILHYNLPLSKVDDNGLMLVDAGAEYIYATDITRTWPVNGKYSEEQKLIYSMVLDVVLTIENQIKPGTLWSTWSNLSMELVTKHLLAAGFISGTYEELIRNRIGGYFYMHGLGHSVGIDVHDPGSIQTLKPNMVLTIEPGIYFNQVYLQDGMKEKPQFFNIPKIQQYLDAKFGGVRIEDTIVITQDGMKVLSLVPKSIQEIEKIMSGQN